jgi:hypothetical protein
LIRPRIRDWVDAKVVGEQHLELERRHVANPPKFACNKVVFHMCRTCDALFCGEGSENECPRYTRAFERIYSKHGDIEILSKCFWCCRSALFFCWGATYFGEI